MIIKLISFALLILFCAVGLYSLQIVDKEKSWNITETSLNNAYVKSSQSFKIDPNDTSMESITMNIVKKIADTMIYVTINVSKIISRFAIENPQINFRLLLNLVYLALILMIAFPLIKVLLIAYVFIKDIIAEKKYKKEIKKLKDGYRN